ncbi:MAG TPA: GTPase HflX [Giesbergeria sp.]|uniref:GTPase HflX n=1 Tax=Acidovorax sp. 210-6 TaxID=2699468 RepID=UPI001389E310|nr:GTPase HflX [Acidovorax sp. 210-6]HMZ85169.1 GTPase HflX [Giesbergeria sp.]NCU65364.1 GTPase HflX [Acidovorax sp. 210-6]HNE72547.1 GTPase HflX [Giesbergeria sp.]HNI75943.1 GTPase HflX [Giesbergeria sp.]HNK05043.1 GTPase HflX [Giesbergeria sp.]
MLLVGVDFGFPHFDGELEELALLAKTAGMEPVAHLTCKRKAPDAALFVGSGKADEIRMLAQMHGAKEVLFDQSLSPAQQRNLERHLEMPVNDRTLLILEIFAQRARSHEGKLQVELARLQYLSTRLVRRWSHLERQTGGAGVRGGPGEKQIELDRRMIDDAIKRTKERLVKVKRQRSTQRRQRERTAVFNVSLVGYTNAGKSTLFNALVKARAYAADQLFATLDTTTRQMYLEAAGCSVSLSDTVGFIRDLPHGLVAAFQATLQEAVDADLLLHVVDAANPHYPEQIQQVQKVLREIGADEIPQILVFNKLDAVNPEARPGVLKDSYDLEGRQVVRLFLSARNAQGLEALRTELAERVLEARLTTMSPELDAPLQDTPDDWAQSPGQP